MKNTIKLLAVTGIIALSTLSASAYETVDCSTDAVFDANSCNVCFIGKDQKEGANLGLIKRNWINDSNSEQIIFTEEQEMPMMKTLSPLVKWEENPTKENFWKYTKAFNALYNKEEEGYILEKGKKVVYLESSKGFAYSLIKNKETAGKNIGLLTSPISTHSIQSNGEISTEAEISKECVLFKSIEKKEEIKILEKKEKTKTLTKKEDIKKLPKTGPEHYLLFLLAMVLGFLILKSRKKA